MAEVVDRVAATGAECDQSQSEGEVRDRAQEGDQEAAAAARADQGVAELERHQGQKAVA